MFFARLYDVEGARQKVRALLAQTGLAARSLDVVRTFSRGMLQRLSLARALIHDPELILLDEPYTGLDPQGVRTLDSLIEEIQGERSFIMVSHQIDAGLERATHVLTLNKGQLSFFGTRDEFTALPAQSSTKVTGRFQ